MAQAQGFSKHLLSHEIFKTAEEESAFEKRHGSYGVNGAKHSQIATRGNELFVAVGNTVRCVDINGEGSRGYKNLNTATVDFGITSILMNDAGTLLAIVGEQTVAVCQLPSSGAVAGPDRIIRVKCRTVGTTTTEPVLKVAWNPIARYDSNLMVLTDGVLRAYDLLWSHDQPEYEYSFSSNDDQFGFDESMEDVVSFALGSSGEPHGKLTCYVLTKEGDVYGLCPWLPNNFVLEKEEVEDLFDNAVTLEYEYRQNQEDVRPEVKRHYKQQLAWASQLWKQLGTSILETKLERDGTLKDLHVLKRPEMRPQEPQGPFGYNPFPDALYEGEPVDIVTMDTGSLTAVVVSYSTGRVNFYLQDTSMDMKWKDSEIESQLSLATMESILLSGKLALQVGKQDLVVFAISDHALYRIDISKWAMALATAMESGSVEQVEQAIAANNRADVINLLSSQDVSNVKGIAILEDTMGNQYSVAKTNLGVWVEQWTESVTPEEVSSSFHQPQDPKQIEMNYETLLRDNTVDKEAREILDGINMNPPQPQSGNISMVDKIEPTMENLEYFAELSNHYTEELALVQKAGYLLHSRLGLQRSEFHRQLTKLGELGKKLDAVHENRAPYKLQEAVSRQSKLQQRTVDLLAKLAQTRELLLSDQEKKWFAELKRMQNKIYIGNGLDRRIKNAMTQADVILREVKVLDKEGVKTSGLEHDSIARLQVLLAKEGEVVETTKQQLKRLVNEVALTDGVGKLGI